MNKKSFQAVKSILKKTSRSFYLSLIIFPPPVKRQICAAYLFCKIADTIVDSGIYPEEKKRVILSDFYLVLNQAVFMKDFLEKIPVREGLETETALLRFLPEGMALFQTFSPEDRKSILDLVHQIIQGMEMDLKEESIHNEKDLDQYCFYVAGSAGAFLTDLFFRFQLIKNNRDQMIPLGVDLGKGLQLTNILRDRLEDQRKGRFYLLENSPTLLPEAVFLKVMVFLENGLRYVLSVPRGSWRIRMASLWPLIFALKTLERLSPGENPDREQKVKISRTEVYRTMIITSFIGFSNNGIKRYFHFIKNRMNRKRGV